MSPTSSGNWTLFPHSIPGKGLLAVQPGGGRGSGSFYSRFQKVARGAHIIGSCRSHIGWASLYRVVTAGMCKHCLSTRTYTGELPYNKTFHSQVTMTWQWSHYNHTGNNWDGDSWYSQLHTQLRYFQSGTATVATGFHIVWQMHNHIMQYKVM